MQKANKQPVKSGYGLVRDRNGKPRIDDITTLHPGVITMLSPEERTDLGLWPGVLVRDAEGVKRANLVSKTDTAITINSLDQIRAASLVYVDGVEYRFETRFNAPEGETIIIQT